MTGGSEDERSAVGGDKRSSVDDSDPGGEPESMSSAGEGRVFVSPGARRDAALRTLALGVGVVGLSGVLAWFEPGVTDPARVQDRLAALGPLAPVAFVVLQTLQVVLAPVPGQVLGGVGGYLFGTAAGTGLSMVGVVVGSAIVFLASERFGRPYVERTIAPATLSRWDEVVERYGAVGLFVLFLLPTFPDDLLCFVAGLSEMRLRRFLALVIAGRTPTFVAASYAGMRLADGDIVVFGGLVLALAVASVFVYSEREQVIERLDDVV